MAIKSLTVDGSVVRIFREAAGTLSFGVVARLDNWLSVPEVSSSNLGSRPIFSITFGDMSKTALLELWQET
jgi:hypothetical protein